MDCLSRWSLTRTFSVCQRHTHSQTQLCTVTTWETKQVIRRISENFPLRTHRAPTGKVKNKPHQMAPRRAAPDESAKRMCQSANRFLQLPFNVSLSLTGEPVLCKNLPRCLECSRMKSKGFSDSSEAPSYAVARMW